MKKYNTILLLILIFSIMIMTAMGDNVRGVFIPEFKNVFSVNNTQMGIMLMVCSLGYMLFTYLGGILCEKIGQKNVMILGLLVSAVSFLSLYFSNSYSLLLLGLFFVNSGAALLAIGINTLIPFLLTSFHAILMNLIHFSYGLGATITQKTVGTLLYRGVSWRYIYFFLSALSLLLLISFIFVKVPRGETNLSSNKINYKLIFKNKMLYFYMLGLGLYVAAELSTGNWFINYIKGSYGYNEDRSAFYSALFFGVFTIGRLIGGFIVEKLDHIKSVLASLIIAFVLYLTGVVLGEKGLIIISISGLFFAIAFPTIVVSIRSIFPENSSYITGIIITAASATSMIINLLLGWLNDTIGVYKAFYLIPISLLFSIVFVYFIYQEKAKILPTK